MPRSTKGLWSDEPEYASRLAEEENNVRKHLITAAGLVVGGALVSAPSEAAPYRDKHGNTAQLALTTPLVGAPLNGGIHFTVPSIASARARHGRARTSEHRA
jgi:hypothetical protein